MIAGKDFFSRVKAVVREVRHPPRAMAYWSFMLGVSENDNRGDLDADDSCKR